MKQVLPILIILQFSCNSAEENKSTITIPAENITPTKQQIIRREKSEAYCKAHNIPVYSNKSALYMDAEETIAIRTKDEVIDRTLALFFIGLKSEGLTKAELETLNKKYNILSKLSPKEKEYVLANSPSNQQTIDANWRYDGLHVLLWTLSFIDTLSYPDTVSNVADDVAIINSLTEEQFRRKAKLRSKTEILDEADLALRLDWACTDARIKNQPMPGNLNKGIVYERHYAFNWLIDLTKEDWDNVTTDT